MSAWLLIGLVWAVLLLFWFWLGKVFDAITDWHAAGKNNDAR
jgi:hypothetical protein